MLGGEELGLIKAIILECLNATYATVSQSLTVYTCIICNSLYLHTVTPAFRGCQLRLLGICPGYCFLFST